MAAKSILVFCAAACFVKIITAQQCLGAVNSNIGAAIAAEELALAYGGNMLAANALAHAAPALGLKAPFVGPALPHGYPPNAFAPSSGGGFIIQSVSPIAPTGITVISENAIEGALAVNGNLPFLGAIALEGALPSAGAGGINYGCGNGAVGIVSEGISSAVGPIAYPAGLGYANGLAGGLGHNGRHAHGIGCGAIY